MAATTAILPQDSVVKMVTFRPKLPPWIRVKTGVGQARAEVDDIVASLKLHTVCQSARCPNLAECWHGKTATFMILGNNCTRNCKFCAVQPARNFEPPDPEEPQHVAEAAEKMGLKFVVVTSVTRDDLPDQGAGHFAETIRAIRAKIPEAKVEVLTPDFQQRRDLLQIVAEAKPDVFNHNVETVRRMTPLVRNKATYEGSLKSLHIFSELAPEIPLKSGIMVGLGETDNEVEETLHDMYHAGVRYLTIGQYLPPSAQHWKLERYVTPETFDAWRDLAIEIGFTQVASGPLVRSSYHAHKLAGENDCHGE